ncbi:MAG: hypothetical protein WA539_14725, partial [Candidatus Sulfotelmatobacter sp.]
YRFAFAGTQCWGGSSHFLTIGTILQKINRGVCANKCTTNPARMEWNSASSQKIEGSCSGHRVGFHASANLNPAV